MTLVMIWFNKPKDPTALHIAADSLLTFDQHSKWPYAPKIFRVYPTHAHIAYCGSAAMGLSALAQATAILGNTNVLGEDQHPSSPSITARSRALENVFGESSKGFPAKWFVPTELLYCAYNRHMSRFDLFKISLKRNGARLTKQDTPHKDRVFCFGSGASKARALLGPQMSMKEILGVLKAVIDEPAEKEVGGIPQMVTLERTKSQAVGFNWTVGGKTESTLCALPLHFQSSMSKVRFLDEKFRLSAYQNDPSIRRLGSPVRRAAKPRRAYGKSVPFRSPLARHDLGVLDSTS
jgi:hypothetical protein